MIAIHDYVYSRTKVHPRPSLRLMRLLCRRFRSVVRVNQRTGARNFYLGSHAREIEGWDHDRSRALIDGLLEDAIADEYIYAHKWRPGEFVIWDNRCLLHRGAGYDADKYRRMMRQSRVLGQGNTVRDNV